MRNLTFLSILLIFSFGLAAAEYKPLHWDELIPEAELEVLKKLSPLITNPHQPLDPNENIRDEISSGLEQLADPDIQGVMNSINVRPELNNQTVSIAGFVVPVQVNDNNAITEFFLVPYFGACIHVPPLPPNQIIYVRYDRGLLVEGIWMPFEIKGTIFTEMIENDTAISAYTFDANDVIEYRE